MRSREYLGELEQVVLLALTRTRGPAYGAEIHKEIQDTTGRDASIPAVCVPLEPMEREGLVASEVMEPPDDGGRATRDYRRLPAGPDSLERSLATLQRLRDGLGADPA